MNISDMIKSLQVDLPSLQAIFGNYLEHSSLPSGSKLLISEKVGSDPSFRSDAMRAVSDAVVFSTLASTMIESADFADALDTVREIEDEFLTKMRIDLFARSFDDLEKGVPNDVLSTVDLTSRVSDATRVFSLVN